MRVIKMLLISLSLIYALGLLGCGQQRSVAVLFVGHGEPAHFQDGNEKITFWDGTDFGPHGRELGVPSIEQATIWAAAYAEVAEALTYQVGDLNANGIPHEVHLFPQGDIPPGFTYSAFKAEAAAEYEAVGGYSPHNDTLTEHSGKVLIGIPGYDFDTYLALMISRPMIPDVLHEIAQQRRYQRLVVVPLLMAESTHTQEVIELVEEWAAKERSLEIVFAQPFYNEPYARGLIASAVADLALFLHSHLPQEVADDKIGIVLSGHGDPFSPPYPEFGWRPGEIYSNLYLHEKGLAQEVGRILPWDTRMANMSFREPTVETVISEFNAQGKTHILVIPSAFRTICIHTLWDLAMAAVGHPLTPAQQIASRALASGTTIWYTPLGYGDIEPGGEKLHQAIRFNAEVGLLELFERNRPQYLSNLPIVRE